MHGYCEGREANEGMNLSRGLRTRQNECACFVE